MLVLVSLRGGRELIPLIYLYTHIKKNLAPQGIFHIFLEH